MDEFKLVKDYLVMWGVKEQVRGMVFDTTASNSGEHSGACRFLEEWLESAVLWLACRRHIAELHLGTAVKLEMGATKDPGMALFRRLRIEWRGLVINYNDLDVTDFSSAPTALQEAAESVLSWAKEQLESGTFQRDDYNEFMELVVVSLGGEVVGFIFKLPGPDHHARWMSKCIYFLKIKLVSKIFQVSAEEKMQVDSLVEFILLFYTVLVHHSSGQFRRQGRPHLHEQYPGVQEDECQAVLCSAELNLPPPVVPDTPAGHPCLDRHWAGGQQQGGDGKGPAHPGEGKG